MASFKSAFAAARKGGKSTFSWNGKSYNTKLKDEAKTESRPKARPAKTSTGSTAKSGPSSRSSASAPAKAPRPNARPARKSTGSTAKSGPATKRPTGTSTGSTAKSGPAAKRSAAKTGKRDMSAPLKDTMVGRALHKANDSIEAWRDRVKSKIKANRKPTVGSRGRGRK